MSHVEAATAFTTTNFPSYKLPISLFLYLYDVQALLILIRVICLHLLPPVVHAKGATRLAGGWHSDFLLLGFGIWRSHRLLLLQPGR